VSVYLDAPTLAVLMVFFPQDVMIRNLTVEENLRFCAFSRLPRLWSEARKMQIVHECVLCVSCTGSPRPFTCVVPVPFVGVGR
jgi:hypothetical protein